MVFTIKVNHVFSASYNYKYQSNKSIFMALLILQFLLYLLKLQYAYITLSGISSTAIKDVEPPLILHELCACFILPCKVYHVTFYSFKVENHLF